MHAYASDAEVTRYSQWGPNTVEETTAFVLEASREALETERRKYTLAAEHDGVVIGSVAVWATDASGVAGELGYTFRRESWGRGFATEAAGLLLRIGFETLGVEQIIATRHPDNIGSARVAAKIGMGCAGTLPAHRVDRSGDRIDSLVFQLNRCRAADCALTRPG